MQCGPFHSSHSSPRSAAVVPSADLEKECPSSLLAEEDELLPTSSWRKLPASKKAKRTSNPIRAIVDPILGSRSNQQEPVGSAQKNFISLALGDPTVFGNLQSCPMAIEVLKSVLEDATFSENRTELTSSKAAAGYVNALGTGAAREAIAQYHSLRNGTPGSVSPEQVIVASGCSGALELVLTSLLDEGSILLVPQPGFPLYQVIAESHGASVQPYRLASHSGWEVDLEHVRSLVNEEYGRFGFSHIRGIVINNPSNPTGAVYGRSHLVEIVKMCSECRLPIVADEIYGDLTFENHRFHPLAAVAAECGNQVPVITCSGIGKQFLLPGWRVGWAVFQDNIHGVLSEVEVGAKQLAQLILGASHLSQMAIPPLLNENPMDEVSSWKESLRKTLEHQANALVQSLWEVPGLSVWPAQGAMYLLVAIDPSQSKNVEDDVDFSKKLLEEENVFVLPGSCFGARNTFRLVFCAPEVVLKEAAARISSFCKKYFGPNSI